MADITRSNYTIQIIEALRDESRELYQDINDCLQTLSGTNYGYLLAEEDMDMISQNASRLHSIFYALLVHLDCLGCLEEGGDEK